MSYLFVTRNNVHARYYKALIKLLSIVCKLHITGKPRLVAINYLKESLEIDLSDVIESQLKRKQARNKIWFNPFVRYAYSMWIAVFERFRYAKYLDLFNSESPEAVVIWNGNKLPNKTVAMAANASELKIFYYENGLVPGTTSLDPQGINFSASLSRKSDFYINFDLQEALIFSAPNLIPRASHKKRNEFSHIELPEKYIFVPFQVPHDTQMACFSPWISSMEMLYENVVQAVKALGDPSLKIVFKEHPSWHKHYNALYKKDDIAVFANNNDTKELIQGAQAVITVNSSVGLESLLLTKKVITLGLACYNIDQLVLHADTQTQLVQCLTEIEEGWHLNELLRDKFFAYLQHIYCLPGIWNKCELQHAKAVEQRLLGCDQFSSILREK